MLTRGEDGYFAVSGLVGLLRELLRACALEIEEACCCYYLSCDAIIGDDLRLQVGCLAQNSEMLTGPQTDRCESRQPS